MQPEAMMRMITEYMYGVGTLFPALMKMSKHHIFKKNDNLYKPSITKSWRESIDDH